MVKLEGSPTGGRPGSATVPLGNTATAIDHFKSEAVGHGVLLGLVHFDQHIFLGLGGYLAPGIDLCPIEDPGVVIEVALRGKQLSLRQRVTGNNGGYIAINQAFAACVRAPGLIHPG